MSASDWLVTAIVLFSLSFVLLVAAVFMFLKFKIPTLIDDLSGRRVEREIREMRERNVSSEIRTPRRSRDGETGSAKDPQKALAHVSRSLSPTVTADLSVQKGSTAVLPSEDGKGTDILDIENGTGTDILDIENGSTTDILYANDDAVTEVLSEINGTEILSGSGITDILSESGGTDVLSESNATEILFGSNVTDILSESNVTDILSESNSTEILSDISDTAVLSVGKDSVGVSDIDENTGRRGNAVPFTIIRSLVEIHTDERIE